MACDRCGAPTTKSLCEQCQLEVDGGRLDWRDIADDSGDA